MSFETTMYEVGVAMGLAKKLEGLGFTVEFLTNAVIVSMATPGDENQDWICYEVFKTLAQFNVCGGLLSGLASGECPRLMKELIRQERAVLAT